jgi:hypothetical protein
MTTRSTPTTHTSDLKLELFAPNKNLGMYTLKFVGDLFGGGTLTQACGIWQGNLHRSYVITVYTTRALLQSHLHRVKLFAKIIAARARWKAVGYTISPARYVEFRVE